MISEDIFTEEGKITYAVAEGEVALGEATEEEPESVFVVAVADEEPDETGATEDEEEPLEPEAVDAAVVVDKVIP